MSCKKKQRLTSEIEYSPVCLDTQSSIFDLIPNEILGVIALFLDADINFDTRKSFFETCKRFRDIGYIVFDNSVQSNLPLRYAARQGYTKEVERLLKDPRVNPSDWDNYVSTLLDEKKSVFHPKGPSISCIEAASANGYTEIVTLLMQDNRMDPIFNQAALRVACQNGHEDVVKILLEDERVDPSVKDNEVFWDAVTSKKIIIVKLLLNHSSIDYEEICLDLRPNRNRWEKRRKHSTIIFNNVNPPGGPVDQFFGQFLEVLDEYGLKNGLSTHFYSNFPLG